MLALLKGAWNRAHLILIGIMSVLVTVMLIFWRGKAVGELEAKTKQREVDDEARKRMDGVKPADAGSTIDSLRNGKF